MRDDVIAVLPAYECEDSVGPVVSGLRRHLRTVIVVDDGSRDDTSGEAGEAGAVVETLSRNRGKGFALRRGIERALQRGPEAILLLDADGQHDPADCPKLIDVWDGEAADLVIGTRLQNREEIPSVRYWTNYIGSRILSWMTGLDLRDSQSGYRLLSAELVDALSLESDGYAIESEMLIKAAHRGARVAHVPVETIYRAEVSHFEPLRDTVRISCRAIYFKVFDDP